MLQETDAAKTIRIAQHMLREGKTSIPQAVADAAADLLDESLTYARLPGRIQQYPLAVKGVTLATAVLSGWEPGS